MTWFGEQAEPLARLCREMAERFARGGRLIATGTSPQARSDARHVAVEFVHPVIVGKRALPALALTAEGGPLERQVELTAEPDDMLMAFDPEGVDLARQRGCLIITFDPPTADPFEAQELVETAYHLLWELVHVFFEHESRTTHDTGASSFLYPFLGAKAETDVDAVLADVAASVVAKGDEIAALRAATLAEGEPVLAAAAAELRGRLDRGGRLLCIGNGGSATDAMDAVADMRFPPNGWRPEPALDLTEDTGVITAVANDIGAEAIFARQVIAHGRAGDVLLAQSTSGNSANVVAALAEARKAGLATIAMVGYDGGRIAAEALADFVVVVRSEHIPRIQEAQATAWHALRGMLEDAPEGRGADDPARAGAR